MKPHSVGGLALALVSLAACSDPTPTTQEIAGATAYLSSKGFSPSRERISDYARNSPAIIGALARCQTTTRLNETARNHCDYLANHASGTIDMISYHKRRLEVEY